MLDLKGKEVEFLSGIEIFDCYLESGMRASVVDVIPYPEDGLYEIFLNYSKYREYNLALETVRFLKGGKHVAFRHLEQYSDEESYCVSSEFDFYKVISNGRLEAFRSLNFSHYIN